jgi:RND family efflux transporter MFP subunit
MRQIGLYSPRKRRIPISDEATMLNRKIRRGAAIAAAVFGVLLIAGIYVRFAQSREVDRWTVEDNITTVALVSPARSGNPQTLSLPGTAKAYYDAEIYARVPGYVKAWYCDIGAKVHKGDLLAVIDTPELDQQMVQAKADLASQDSALKLAQTTASRWKSLLPLDAVSRQDVEEKSEGLANASDQVNAAKANLDRLEAMKAFARIVAPFDGVVTKRGADVGALVSAGPSASEPLFAVSDISQMRIYVEVPQAYSSEITPGMKATLALSEFPGRNFEATLATTSNAIGDKSGALLVELDANNSSGALKPGDYVQADFQLPVSANDIRVPASALIFRGAGLRVATVDANDRIVMKPIGIARDLGTEVEISYGLTKKDRVVNNPPDSLGSGDRVRIAQGSETYGE